MARRCAFMVKHACTHYDTEMQWNDIYNKYVSHEPIDVYNTTTIARIRPVISPAYPDCDNFYFTDQLRADVFIDEWKKFEQLARRQPSRPYDTFIT